MTARPFSLDAYRVSAGYLGDRMKQFSRRLRTRMRTVSVFRRPEVVRSTEKCGAKNRRRRKQRLGCTETDHPVVVDVVSEENSSQE